MYELSIQRIFSARHAISMNGVVETPHHHDWVLCVEVQGEALDGDGLLVDFHELERMIDDIISPYVGADFNAIPPFTTINPTAERIAEYIGRSLMGILRTNTDNQLSLKAVRVMEAPNCVASYLPE